MSLAVTKVTLSKQAVQPRERIKISVVVKTLTPEPVMYRMPFTLGRGKIIVALKNNK